MSAARLPAIDDLLDILPDAVVMVDTAGRILYVNPAVRALLGYPPEEIVGQPLGILIPRQLRERHEAVVSHFQKDGQPTMMGSRPVLHAVHRSGTLVPVSISLCNWTLHDDTRVSVAVMHDVAALHTDLDRATALAETDPLSGLANRLRLSRRVQALLADERPFGLLYLDLERFKQVNDRHGHAAGDQVLQIVARRLQSRVRDMDLLARLGGDEFGVVLAGVDEPEPLRQCALKLAEVVCQPFRVGDLPGAVGVNIGGALSPRDGDTESALMAAADRAMYAAKQAGELYRLAAG